MVPAGSEGMKLLLETESMVRLVPDGEGFVVEDAAAVGLSPFHLLGAALATCSWSVLTSWAQHARLGLEGLELAVEWRLGGDPVRVSNVRLTVLWPGLSEARLAAARRAAAQCTIHHTLARGSAVETRVVRTLNGGGWRLQPGSG
jgi:uncharacterized OsmC-like protein